MEKCSWQPCRSLARQIFTKNILLIDVYSCGSHDTYYCSLCKYYITSRLSYVDNFNINIIRSHIMSFHTFKIDDGNYLYPSSTGLVLANHVYRMCKLSKLYRFCNISNIIEANKHFIYLIPGFSFSDILDQFDEVNVNDWRLLAAVRHKSFSCLMCGGRFESFPSNEVFAAHPCKS